jgi:hypothetical protein
VSGAGERGFLDHMADLVDLGKKVVSGEVTGEALFNDAAGDNKPADPADAGAIETEGVAVPDTEPAPALRLVPPEPTAKPEP